MIQIFTDPRCLQHPAPPGYAESQARLSSILERMEEWPGGRLREATPQPGAQGAVEAVHDPVYVERFRRAVQRGDGILDSADNPISTTTGDAVWGAVGVVLTAAEAVVRGEGPAFAAVRPPGHHAERDRAMGFCFVNNVAVAAHFLRTLPDPEAGIDRVAIYDFDVHHGNGTQHLFEERSDILFISSHQFPFYPGTGAARERGVGEGAGATLNVPLQAGSGDAEIARELEEVILPALRHFEPDALLVSAGFDAWLGDPLGGLRWSLDTYHRLGRELAAVAEDCCQGRLLSVLEGGYDVANLPALVERYLQGIIDFRA